MENKTKKVYLLAGHSSSDPGAIGINGRKEADETIKLRNAVAERLKEMKTTVIIDNDRQNLRQVLAAISANEEDLVVDLHFDSASNSNATGTTTFIPDRSSGVERILAAEITTGLSSILGIKNRGVLSELKAHTGSLGVMRENGTNVLVEVCFISNAKDMISYDEKFDHVVEHIATCIKKRM